MKYSNTVEYNISTKLDSSGLTKLQSQIKQLENSMQQMANRELLNSDKVQAAKTQLEGLNTALTNSFNSSLGILDLSKFRAELDKSGVSAAGLQSAFNMMGAEGQAALNGLTTQIANFNGGMERTSSAVDKIFTTFSNTFRWGMISSFFSQFMNAIHSSIDYVKELDDSLTQIMLVTDYNRDSMNEFARSANEAAKAVSMTTTGMTNASLIFAQQGYNLGQSQELATLSAKLANASQQDTATTSDQITAYMNAYGLENSIGELTQAMDNWALIANISAADVSELAQASQRAASMANTVGVSGEQLAAQIATIESVTREAPEQIGNGLKTLYARFSDISAGGEDEEGVSLGDVTKQLNDIGVRVLDQFGNIRDVGDIMEDLMVIWDDLDQTSKIAAAQSLAGKYQVNRFVSLMDNSDMYKEYLGATGSPATGTLDQMSQEVADSFAGRMTKLQASLEGLFSTIFNTDDIYPWMDAAQGAVDLLQQFFDALGGGKTVLLGITSLLTQAFSQNIARGINDTIANRNLGQVRKQNIDTVSDTLDRVGIDRTQGVGAYIDATAQQAKLRALSDAQYDTYMNNVQQWANAQTALTQAQEELTDTINVVNMAYGKTTGNKNAIFNDEGVLNTQLANEERANLSDRQLNRLMQDTDFSDVAEKAKEFSQSLQNVENQMKKVDADSEDYDQQMTNLAQAIDLAGDKLAEFNALNVASDDMVESILGDLTSLETKIRAGGEASEEAEKEIAELISMIGRLGKSAKDMNPQAFKQAMLGAGDLVDKKKNNVDFAQTQTNRAEENALDSQKNIDSQQQIKGILDTLNAVQQLTFAWQSFQNLGSLWANEDLSTGEKVLQTIMNLTMAMPQLITAMDTLKGSDFLKNIGENLLQSLDFSKNGQKSLFAKEQFDELVEYASAGRDAMKALGNAGKSMSDEIRQGLKKTIAEGALAEDALTKIGPELLETSMVGTTGLEAIKASLSGLATSAATFLAEFWPLLLIGAAVAGISALIGAAQEQAEQAHQEAISALEDAKNAQKEIQNLSSSIEEWESKRNSQGENKKLAQEADELSKTMRELGADEQASAVHLAALRAEAKNTAENFDILAQAINNAQTEMNNQAYLDTMNAANEVLKNQLSTEEEIATAREDMQNAALDYNLNQISQVNGSNMGILGVAGNNDLRAATADWQSLDALLKEAVPGFKDITDENERLALALSHTSDEALRAGIQIEQLLNANSSLSDARTIDYGAGDIGTVNERENITQQLQTAGFSAQESLQLLATLDKDASMEEISERIAEIQSEMELNGDDFDLALKGTLSEEDAAELTKNQISSFEAMDEDIDTEAMQDLAEYIRANAEELDDFSDSVALDAEELAELSEEILRYDDALQSAQDSMEDWEDMLTSGATQDAAQATKELVDTYNDLLDVGEGASVSTDFAGDIDNLNLLKAAIEGDEEAYTELQRKAAEDIILNIATNDEAAQAAFDKVWGMINEVDGYYATAEVGAELDDADFIAALEEMINAAGMTADQATAALSAMGVDAEIESETDTEETPATAIGLTAVPYTETVTGQFPVANLGSTAAGAQISLPTTQPFTASFPAVRYEPQEVDASSTMALTGFSLKTTSGGKSSGGGLSIKSAKKGNTGGSKFRNASHGGGASGGGRGGGGGGKGSCFVAGTLITTQTSFKPIEQIQKGDIVLSYNEQIGFNQYSKVVQTMIHDTIEPIYTLYIKNEQLRVTGIHRFFVTDKITSGISQWICAADLHIGQWVLFADGTWHVIHKIEINIEHQTVYNFEVSGNHNYYVGRNQILAHNKGGGGGGKGSTPKTIEPKEKKDHQKDYYEEVKSQLEKTEKVLSKIEKEEDRLIGDEARANQNRQIKFLEKEIKLNEKKLKINKQELKDVDDKIKKEIELAKAQAGQYGVNANIPEIKYDEDGVISNYEEISAAIDRIHNELIDKYNAAAAASNEELTKEIQKAIDKFDKYGDNVLKNAQRHNALQSEIEETKNTLEELQDAIEDIRIEAKHAAMEAIDDIKDLNKSMAELDGFFSGFKLDSAKRDLTELGSELDSIFNNDNAVNYYNNLIAEQDKMIEKAKEAVKTAKDAEEKEKAQALLESRTLTKNALIEQRDRAQNALNSDQEWKGGILGLQQQHIEDLTKRLEAFNNAELNGKEYVDPIFGKNKAALMEYLEEARSGLADTLIQVEELVEDFRSSLIDLYDESADKQQKLQDEFDRQTEKLETRMDWYTLYYGDEAYDAMNQFYTKEGELLAAQSRRRKEDADFWYAEAEKLRIKSQQQGIELDKEQYDHLLDLAKEAESESEELATKSAEAFKDAFDKAIDAVGQKFYRTIFSNINRDVNGAPEAFANSVFNNNRIYDTSYLGITDNNGNPITQASLTDFNDIKTKWELQKEYSSKYRDNMERSYEIDKLRAKYMDILNNAQNMSLQTQNKIRAQMQDQLDYLKGQTTLSEYDVKLANARLEILQKQIALEEAQRNKNKMQLRRDTQGNYRYVYTADKGDTDKAQQELDDSLFDAYEITKEQSLQNVDSLLSSLQNYMEQRSEILRRYSANDAETAQKRAAALAMLDEEYKQIWTALGEDFSDTMQGLDEVLTWTIENGNANTVEAASEMLDAVNNHNYDILGEMNASWIGWSDDMRFNVLPAISEATQEAMVESEVAVRDFAEHLVGPDGILPELNSGINSYKDILDKTKQSTNELAKASEELATALNADSIEFQKKTEQLLGYQQELNNTKNTTSKLRDELNKARELLEKEKKKTAALTQGIKDIAAGTAVAGADGSVKGKSKPGGSGTKNSGKWHVGDRVGFHGWYNYTSWGQRPAGNLWSDQENAVVISDFSDISVGGTQETGEYTIHLQTPQGGWLGWVRPDQLFDTGGYTGQWSDGDKNAKNGKWAMLHEKELVLNANDTENILQAVNMLRKFTNALGISKLSLNGLTTNQGQIEQRVEINASFPNVHSAEDVEAALLEIADQAYIYAHKD